MPRLSLYLGIAFAVVASTLVASADPSRPDYLAGYAAAVIERDLGLQLESIKVVDGVARVRVGDLQGVSADSIREALSHIEGIDEVLLLSQDEIAEPPLELEPDAEESDGFELLPRRELFEPLLADPRQPRFSVSGLWYQGDSELGSVGSANFGETFALIGGEWGDTGARWEAGILGGVFAIFDLEAESLDLVNVDFWVAPTFSLRSDWLSTQLRVYHQSSHLGDEFLLRERVDRINLSYEGVDLLVSADLHSSVRLYVGGGAIVSSEPHLDPFSAQVGLELQSPLAFLGGTVRPLAAGDLRVRQEDHWDPAVSAVAGFQLENPKLSPLRLLILFEYFRGNSPNGQFFERSIESIGVGTHLHF